MKLILLGEQKREGNSERAEGEVVFQVHVASADFAYEVNLRESIIAH